MALMWWPVAILGALCLLGTVALAVLIPTRRSPGDGLALANTSRSEGFRNVLIFWFRDLWLSARRNFGRI